MPGLSTPLAVEHRLAHVGAGFLEPLADLAESLALAPVSRLARYLITTTGLSSPRTSGRSSSSTLARSIASSVGSAHDSQVIASNSRARSEFRASSGRRRKIPRRREPPRRYAR